MELPKRKEIRLKEHDYSSNGAYFITLCIQNHHEILGVALVGDGVLDVPMISLSDYGIIVKKQIEEMSAVYSYLQIPKYVIMPNHIHLIVEISADIGMANSADIGMANSADIGMAKIASGMSRQIGSGMSRTPSPTNAVIPRFVSTLKRYNNKKIGFPIWQRSFHDHIIRNQEEYKKIWQYIDTNPHTWAEDCYFKK